MGYDPRHETNPYYIRGLRVTVDTIVGLIAFGLSPDQILKLYPYLEESICRKRWPTLHGGLMSRFRAIPQQSNNLLYKESELLFVCRCLLK